MTVVLAVLLLSLETVATANWWAIVALLPPVVLLATYVYMQRKARACKKFVVKAHVMHQGGWSGSDPTVSFMDLV